MRFPWRKRKRYPGSGDSAIVKIWGPLLAHMLEEGNCLAELYPRSERVRGVSGFLRWIFRRPAKYRDVTLPDEVYAGETVHLPRMSSLSASPAGELLVGVGYEAVPWIDPLAPMPAKKFKIVRYDPTLAKWVVAP